MKRLRVLAACEHSGVVRRAFNERGHIAMSCDLLPSDDASPMHYRGDVRDLLVPGRWDLIVAFPDCTYLCASGLHWNRRRPDRAKLTESALEFAGLFLDYQDGECKVAVENSIGCISTRVRPPDQIIHPWQFGHDASKATCLWLRGLPLLVPTNVLPGGRRARRANQTPSGQNKLGPSPDRWKLRSRTYDGIGAAMAEQWGRT